MDTFEKLKEAKQLFDQGILTETEYQELKDRLLKSMDNEPVAQPAQPASTANTVTFSSENTGAAYSGTPGTGAAPAGAGASTGMKILSFLIPLVGLILFIVDRDKKPEEAKDELLWAGIGFAVGIVLYIIMAASAASYY